MPDRSTNAVITDPPYGIGDKFGDWNAPNGRARLWNKRRDWDEITEHIKTFVESLPSLFEHVVILGGHYYTLPPSRCWLVWDKMQQFSGAESELAWTNFGMPIRTFRMSRIDAYWNKAIFRKEHPTEKPFQLMMWCTSFLPEGTTVFDPFIGSGATAVAALKTGRHFFGCDINPDYVALANERIERTRQELAQMELAL